MIPVLFITHNRLEYSKQALQSLLDAQNCAVIVIDNASTDGTVEWLKSLHRSNLLVIYNEKNTGVSGAMNQFLGLTELFRWVGKVDNDTVVPEYWADDLIKQAEKHGLDIIQAKHHIIKATNQRGWEGFIADMQEISEGLYLHNYVGGSGIVFRRNIIKEPLPKTDWILGGWFDWQLAHPEVKKAFYEEVEIKLLDEKGYGDYPDYYKETKRIP
jgi:glycosyltransferase involved in cell wall biosynthesis